MTFILIMLRAATLVVLAFLLGTFARGQGSTVPQSRGARPDAVQREVQRQFEMQMMEKALTEDRSRKPQRFSPLVLEQIRADFLRIQVVERKLTQAVSLPEALDLELVGKSAAEIKKKSARLKKNLALPAAEVTKLDRSRLVVEARIEALRTSVSSLSNLIEEFVSNPMFEQVRLIDAQLSAKARRDIETIIELSGEIKRSSEKLKKAAKSGKP